MRCNKIAELWRLVLKKTSVSTSSDKIQKILKKISMNKIAEISYISE
jgi:hypothetical protein